MFKKVPTPKSSINESEDDFEATPLLSVSPVPYMRKSSPIEIQTKYATKRTSHINLDSGDLLQKIQFKSAGKRFIIIGLGHKCHLFEMFNDMWDYIAKTIRMNDTIWIDVQDPSIQDVKNLEKRLGLHPLTSEDIITKDTGEKWQFFPDYFYLVLTAQTDDEQFIQSTTLLNILIFKRYVVTIHDKPIRGLDLVMKRISTDYELDVINVHLKQISAESPTIAKSLRSTRSRSNTSPFKSQLLPEQSTSSIYKYSTPSSLSKLTMYPVKAIEKSIIPSADWILYAFVDAIVDLYIPVVVSIYHEVENMDDLVSRLSNSEHKEMLQRIGLANRNIIEMKRLLERKERITRLLVLKETDFICNDVKIYLRDVLDHLRYCLDRLDVAKDSLIRTHGTYLMKIQIEIARASSRTSSFINRFSFFGTIAVPPMLIIGLYGMNIPVPGQSHKGLAYFIGILAVMMLIVFFLLAMLRRYRPPRIYR